MTIVEELCKYLELYLCELRHCRMYPVGYEKGAAMHKMTQRHISALCHAEQYIYPAVKGNLQPRQKAEIEKDLECLEQIKTFLYHAMGTPELPYGDASRDKPAG